MHFSRYLFSFRDNSLLSYAEHPREHGVDKLINARGDANYMHRLFFRTRTRKKCFCSDGLMSGRCGELSRRSGRSVSIRARARARAQLGHWRDSRRCSRNADRICRRRRRCVLRESRAKLRAYVYVLVNVARSSGTLRRGKNEATFGPDMRGN